MLVCFIVCKSVSLKGLCFSEVTGELGIVVFCLCVSKAELFLFVQV